MSSIRDRLRRRLAYNAGLAPPFDRQLMYEAKEELEKQAAEIERLRKEHEQDQIKRSREFESRIGNYPLKSIQQKDSEIERLKKAIEDANLAGFKEGFNSAENQLAELKADNERLKTIITSNLHERTCHECGKLEWTTKNIGHLHTCDECYLKFLGRLRGT